MRIGANRCKGEEAAAGYPSEVQEDSNSHAMAGAQPCRIQETRRPTQDEVKAPHRAKKYNPHQQRRGRHQGGEVGEPNALARLAEKSDTAALATAEGGARRQLLLDAFKYYAAAAERARREDWPDEAWRYWR